MSTYLHEALSVGDKIEMRGPIGGYFVWETSAGGPLLLVAGGSGIVPLMAMVRHRTVQGARVPTRLLYSVRDPTEVIYGDELKKLAESSDGFEAMLTFTRAAPPGWKGYARRIDRAMLSEVAGSLGRQAKAYICGPTLLVENVATLLLQTGIPREFIRTERFGPTGGNL